ncbi:hypothetical protein D5086_023835 [Populus alba]|uniref:Uncharacterized protein n=1 Tax=Populus alba TaxID=43335 RepID=A0ACC4BBD4_POPAL
MLSKELLLKNAQILKPDVEDRTTLVIAHRLSTVQNPHQIALCSGGRIAELWTTQSEFLDKEGQFSSLAAAVLGP